MIRLDIVKLEKRTVIERQVGRHMSKEYLYTICMLEDETEYSAAEIASLVYEPGTSSYLKAKKAIYMLGWRRGLTTNPDSTHPVNRWKGKHWKEALNDRLYNEAVNFFAGLQKRHEDAALRGQELVFYFSEQQGLIESNESGQPNISSEASGQDHYLLFRFKKHPRVLLGLASCICVAIIIGILWVNKYDQLPPAEYLEQWSPDQTSSYIPKPKRATVDIFLEEPFDTTSPQWVNVPPPIITSHINLLFEH